MCVWGGGWRQCLAIVSEKTFKDCWEHSASWHEHTARTHFNNSTSVPFSSYRTLYLRALHKVIIKGGGALKEMKGVMEEDAEQWWVWLISSHPPCSCISTKATAQAQQLLFHPAQLSVPHKQSLVYCCGKQWCVWCSRCFSGLSQISACWQRLVSTVSVGSD